MGAAEERETRSFRRKRLSLLYNAGSTSNEHHEAGHPLHAYGGWVDTAINPAG
ncbi:MAG: hypothetical protein FGF50_07565 [Candidatus Brockarchaeota archaeon]|nr:hypothetical protein [Candidatus Brockarchaeota archaeon]